MKVRQVSPDVKTKIPYDHRVVVDRRHGRFTLINKLGRKPSENAKTADMAQQYILSQLYTPAELVKLRLDALICGDCPLKGVECYVNVATLTSLWLAAKDLPVTPCPTYIKPLRLGAYGDPAFVPMASIRQSLNAGPGVWTGYTHRWHIAREGYSRWLMASIDHKSAIREGISILELKRRANDLGYRTFRILMPGDQLDKGEILCPYVTHGVQCANCGLCSGTEGRGKADIAVPLHGSPIGVRAYQKSLNLQTIEEA
jgi:hypothetical protein